MRKARKAIWILNGILCAVLLLIGCFHLIENSKGLQSDKSSQSATNVPKAKVAVEQTEKKENMPATIAIGGDVLLKEYHESIYDESGASGIVSSEVRGILQDADIAMINEEFPFATEGEKDSNKETTYRVDPKYATLYNDIGIDLVSLANDHSMDYGKSALMDSCETLENAGIKYAGAGDTADRAKEIQYMDVNETKIAFIAASRVVPDSSWNATEEEAGILSAYDTDQVSSDITEAKEYADYVIVYLHWGKEYKTKPEEYQQTLAKEFIDAGADVIVGSHSHCLQGIEYYKNCPIIYSIGDFILDKAMKRTALISLTVGEGKECTLKIYPCFIRNAKTDLMTKESSISAFYEYIQSISENISIDSDGSVTEVEE